jgi:hypothetical protein
MLSGTAPLIELAGHAATMADLATAAETFPDAVVVQAMYEIASAGRQTSLPAGLHPTNPPSLVVQAWRCPESPWGPFALVQLRVGCRSGLRPRGMVQACVVDSPTAAEALRARWGFPAQVGTVRIEVGYHETVVTAGTGPGPATVELRALDPVPLGPDDVSFTTTVVLAHTPRGDRLVQVDTDLAVTRAERLRLLAFAGDPAGIGVHPSVQVRHPVAASVSRGALTLQPLRFVNRPEELAFTGTERADR